MILTIDLGTTVTKAVVWGDDGPIAVGRAAVTSTHPHPGWVEQQPDDWWHAVVDAVGAAASSAGDHVTAVAFSAARETFVPVREDGTPLGAALVWSDRRAAVEAAELGVDVGASSAKALWLERHDSARLVGARWLLAPRDWIALRLTGAAVTDTTLASRTGWYTAEGGLRAHAPSQLLPPVVPSATIVGEVAGGAGLPGVPAGVPVVIGAGDRPCEVLGTGATPDRPMASWGTTANLSVPLSAPPASTPGGPSLSAGALHGFLLECGLSAAGAALEWLARLTGRPVDALGSLAAEVQPGAGGALALPWFNGARAPWWEPTGRAAFVGLTPAAGAAELARAIYEGVAFDLARCADLVAGATGTPVTALCGAGGGAITDLWPAILAAVTECPVERRAHADLAASTGARLIAASALNEHASLDDINPVSDVVDPDPEWVGAYRLVRAAADRAADAVLRT